VVLADTPPADPDDARIARLLADDWPAAGPLGFKLVMRKLAHELRAEIAAAVEPHDRELARQIRTGRTAR
jgi:hypothetical protein